ncbi:hypothetical protein [Rhodococcus erythropolis]
MAEIKMNKKWLDDMSKVSAKVPVGSTQAQAAAALKKEMKKKGLTK